MRGFCCICSEFDRKCRNVYPHGLMCPSCAYAYFCYKRGGKWLKAVST